MDPLIIEATEETPFVHFDSVNNIFEISGNSYPEDSTAFYLPVINWISDFSNNPPGSAEFRFSFIYLNSSSYKAIYDVLHILNDLRQQKGVEVSVKWFYKEGDVDIREIGEGLAETLKFPFSIAAI